MIVHQADVSFKSGIFTVLCIKQCCYSLLFPCSVTMGKRRFLPNERCLGGALELNATYSNYLRKTHVSRQQEISNNAAGPSAEQLSQHRARKLAESDHTQLNHQRNMHHLFRRMQEAYSVTERRKDPYDIKVNPAPVHRTLRPNSAVVNLCPWLPNTRRSSSGNRRPLTAPGALTQSSRVHGSSNSQEQLKDWQQLKQKPVLEPPVQIMQLPPSRYYPGPNLLPSVQHKLYKGSIMSDILDRQLCKAREIRALCGDYVASSPVEHRELIRAVAAEVLQELDIHQ